MEYRFDGFVDGTEVPPAEQYIDALKSFVTSHHEQVQNIHETLEAFASQHWDMTVDPLSLALTPYEQIPIMDIISDTDNDLLERVMKVFSALAFEIKELEKTAHDKFYPAITLFGRGLKDPTKEPLPPGVTGDKALVLRHQIEIQRESELAVEMGRLLPTLVELQFFVTRCHGLVLNLVQQLAALHFQRQKLWSDSFCNIQLLTAWESLGSVLSVLVTLDALIDQNQILMDSWRAYGKVMRTVRNNADQYKVGDNKMGPFEMVLQNIHGLILDHQIFKAALDQPFDIPGRVVVLENPAFADAFAKAMGTLLTRIADRLARPSEGFQRRNLVGLASLLALYMRLCQVAPDRRMVQALWATQRKAPLVHLYGSCYWWLGEFIITWCPALMVYIGTGKQSDYKAEARSYLRTFDASFTSFVAAAHLGSLTWMVQLEGSLEALRTPHQAVGERSNCLAVGLMHAYHVSNLARTYISLHMALNEDITPIHARTLSRCMTLLGIQAAFYSKSALLADYHPAILNSLASRMGNMFAQLQAHILATSRNLTRSQLDVIASCKLAVKLLGGPLTPQRITVLRMCLDVVSQKLYTRDKDVDELMALLRQIETVATFNDLIAEACDTSFLYYWGMDLIPIFLADIYQHPSQAHQLQYLLMALHDPLRHLKATHPTAASQYRERTLSAFEDRVINPLCRDIETDLRLHVQRNLLTPDALPPPTFGPDRSPLIQLPPLRLFENDFHIAGRVSHYLDTTFYNMTTLALHDWKTYGEMKNLAKQKYGLILTDSHLPTQTLEQGMDVLEIMRGVHQFVRKFKYNLNNQIFVEEAGDNKTLNTISIRHIANSIRTHGTGIMNTTVNIIYQFLTKKIGQFCQFLGDEHVKALLLKDFRFWQKNRERLNNQYPWERAAAFNMDIRKLGPAPNNEGSYLDMFRRLITEIGNALGFVRMVRSGGIRYCSEAIKFVPDLENIIGFAEHTARRLSPETVECAKSLDATLSNLTKNFSEGIDFFQLLVGVFQKSLEPAGNMALRPFYCVVPALTINYIDSFLTAKDRLAKKHNGAAFTDDGFAIGLAFFVQLLDQNTQFDSLHWFASVAAHLKSEEDRIREQLRTARRPQDELQTLQLTLRRSEAYRNEFNMLFFSFSGARIFFKDDTTGAAPAAPAPTPAASAPASTGAAPAPTASPAPPN
ncbi:putative WASH complex subunit 4 [Paratrimastix pyriformis]|uniref:WASH complex subunit 4 n=1 Tax=Paratrimastix pyriformis TaxID=342808 RepID=A0ABQ8UUT7_9EUKA|nr:putative WASH complex subunit 4 [Paratrimastix pyriformis]